MTEEDDIDGLAGEYVLGSLGPTERRQVDARRQTEVFLDAAILAWERRLAPLSECGQELTPPAHVFDAILRRISSQVAQLPGTAEVVPLRRASGRHWAVATASALAACLLLVVGWLNYQQPTALVHSKMDCGQLYKDFWQTRDPQSYARTSPEQLAGISRMVLRAYDACQAGDEQDARSLLARLRERSGGRSPKSIALPG